MNPRIAVGSMSLIPLDLPMRQPFVTALGQKKITRNLLVAARLSNGMTGYGEASASLAWPDDTQTAMTRVLQSVVSQLIGLPIRAYREGIDLTWRTAGHHPTAAAALECALVDAAARAQETCLWCWYGAKVRSISTGLTLSAWKASIAARAAESAARRGFRQFKIKVTGQDLEEDERRVLAVAQAAPKAALLLDGNQGFSPSEAVRFVRGLDRRKIRVKLFEQPVARDNLEGLFKVQADGKIPVIADESVRNPNDLRHLLRKGKLYGVNIKVAKSGLIGAREMTRMARAAGMKRMIGCMAESAIGLTHSVALACGTGAFDWIDLDSHLLVSSPDCQPGFTARGPRLWVRKHRWGSGIELPIGRFG